MTSQDCEISKSFQEKMQQTAMAGFALTGISLGINLKLFEFFEEKPITSEELANRSNCKERYVREWLHHMVVCDVVDVDETGKNFTLPKHKKDVLLDGTQLITGLGSVVSYLHMPHKDIVECFRKEGPMGVPFDKVLPFFAEVTSKNPQNILKCADYIRDNVPSLREQMAAGIKVCEIGVGKGVMLTYIASQFPNSQFVGFDLCESLLEGAKENLAKQSLVNVELLLKDATALPSEWNNSFDFVMIRDVLHDIAHPMKALEGIFRCMKPGGRISIYEMNLDSNPYKNNLDPRKKSLAQIVYMTSTYHCLSSSLNEPGSVGLGAGCGVDTIVSLIKNAGFEVPDEPTAVDYANVHILCIKPR